MNNIVVSPIFYMGNKKKLIARGLCNLFPKEGIDTFYDLFAGSAIVSMNCPHQCKIVVNDINPNLIKFYRMFQSESAEAIITHILNNIEKFGLKRTSVNQKSDEAEIYKSRYIALRDYTNSSKDWKDIYTCMFYAFSQQMRFNGKGEFNMPFGNRAFTEQKEQYIRNGCEFFHNPNVVITNSDFRQIDIDMIDKHSFVYLDPPYFNTTATYNENTGWSIPDELDLFTLCEQLDSHGIKFGMSNVFQCKGKENTHLIDWCTKCGWRVFTFDGFTYMACGKGNSQAKEVYICNYDIDVASAKAVPQHRTTNFILSKLQNCN